MKGACPEELRDEFLEDVANGLSPTQLSEKYEKTKRTIRYWKRSLRPDGGKSENLITVATTGNYKTATSSDKRIRTEEDLRAACGLSKDEWKCLYFKAGTYEGFAKKEDKDLTIVNGVISGHSKSKGILIAPMFRTEGKFVRRQPILLRPTLKVIECPVTFSEMPRAKGGVQTALISADWQLGYRRTPDGALVPYHDRRALDIFMQIVTMVQPDVIALLGDIHDFAELTDKFVKEPGFQRTLQPALLEGHWWMSGLRHASPDSSFELHQGNHEKRLNDFIAMHLQAACELRAADEIELAPAMSAERLMGLDKLGIKWVSGYPSDLSWLCPGLRLQHGDTTSVVPGATARNVVESSDESVIFGHGHKAEQASRKVFRDGGWTTITAWSPGCMCAIDGTVPGSKSRHNWTQGIAYVEYTDNGSFTGTQVRIEDGKALFQGLVFEGRDRVEDLKKDLSRWKW